MQNQKKCSHVGYYEGYGGRLLNTRRGRRGARPLTRKGTMHLILKSTRAIGGWSFKKHRREVNLVCAKFSTRHGVDIISFANVGNHLHFHIKIPSRAAYKRFIRAITGAIAMAVAGISRWTDHLRQRFWDYRPFTRVVEGAPAYARVEDYILINQLEGAGLSRLKARESVRAIRLSARIYSVIFIKR